MGSAILMMAVTGLRGVSQTREGQSELLEELAYATGRESGKCRQVEYRTHTAMLR